MGLILPFDFFLNKLEFNCSVCSPEVLYMIQLFVQKLNFFIFKCNIFVGDMNIEIEITVKKQQYHDKSEVLGFLKIWWQYGLCNEDQGIF